MSVGSAAAQELKTDTAPLAAAQLNLPAAPAEPLSPELWDPKFNPATYLPRYVDECPAGTVPQHGGVTYVWSNRSTGVRFIGAQYPAEPRYPGHLTVSCKVEQTCERYIVRATGGGASPMDRFAIPKPSMECRSLLRPESSIGATHSTTQQHTFIAFMPVLRENQVIEPEKFCEEAAGSICSSGQFPFDGPQTTEDGEARCCVDPSMCEAGATYLGTQPLPMCRVFANPMAGTTASFDATQPQPAILPNPDGVRLDKTEVASFYCSLCDTCSTGIAVVGGNFMTDGALTCRSFDPKANTDACDTLHQQVSALMAGSRRCYLVKKWRWIANQSDLSWEEAKRQSDGECQAQVTLRGPTWAAEQCAREAREVVAQAELPPHPGYCCKSPVKP